MAAALLRISPRPQSLLVSKRPALLHRAIHTWVWWDFNSCDIPYGFDMPIPSIPGNITDALAKSNYNGPVTFHAYGDPILSFDPKESVALKRAGVRLREAPWCRLNCGSRQILVDTWLWAKKHPAPANYFLITGEGDLSAGLHQLRMQGYNILLAKCKEVPAEMEAVAETVWWWRSLMEGGPPIRSKQ